MTKGIVFSVCLGLLVMAPISAQAAACFNPAPGWGDYPRIAVDVVGVFNPFISLVGEVVTLNTVTVRPVSWLATGSAMVFPDGTIAFILMGAFGNMQGTLTPPNYTTGFIQTSPKNLPIAAVACPPLPE